MNATERTIARTGQDIEPFSPDSCLKPVGELAKTIQATSPGDMLLFMIAMRRRKNNDCNCGAQNCPDHRPHSDNCAVYKKV